MKIKCCIFFSFLYGVISNLMTFPSNNLNGWKAIFIFILVILGIELASLDLYENVHQKPHVYLILVMDVILIAYITYIFISYKLIDVLII